MAADSQTATATTSEKPMENKVNEEAELMEKEIVLQETEDVVKDKPVSDSDLPVTKVEEQFDQTPACEPEKESPAVVKAEESAEERKDESDEKKVSEQVELKEPTLVAEVDTQAVDEEKAEEKKIVESVVQGNNKDKVETKVFDVSEPRDEAGSKQVELVDVQLVREVPLETVEVVKAEERPETKAQAKVQLEEKAAEYSDTAPQKEPEGDASSPVDVIEKTITEEKHVLEKPSKSEQERASEAKDVVTKLATEDENITKETTKTTAAEDKSEEALKETDTETREKETEGNKQEDSVADRVSEVVEVSDEVKQQAEVTTKEAAVKQKHSNSIMSKVKQSLVKAKKAIIGKSPSSKTITTEESKEETKVK